MPPMPPMTPEQLAAKAQQFSVIARERAEQESVERGIAIQDLCVVVGQDGEVAAVVELPGEEPEPEPEPEDDEDEYDEYDEREDR